MKIRDKTQAHLRDDIESPGIGLFVNPRAQASADKAYAKAAEDLYLTPKGEAWLREAFLDAARHYWADRDYDERTLAVDMRPEIDALRKALTGISKPINQLSADARAMLRAARKRKTWGAGGDPIDGLQEQIAILLELCEPIVTARGKKGPREKEAVARCCSRLRSIRERITGRKFPRTFTPAPTERGSSMHHFTGPDAQFVLMVMQAMDGDVTLSQVHDGLRKHAATLSSAK